VLIKKPLALACAAGVFWAVYSSSCLAIAQPQAQALPMGSPHMAQASRTVPIRAASSPRSNGKQLIRPLWTELTPAQQQALAPLAPKWDTVSEVQKRKWLALSQNFPKMSGAEQAKLHSRMTEWVTLSPQQRTQARLSFGETKQLSPDDKKAKWEAYQALSAEEKSKLAAGAAKPPATAAAIKPVAPEKLAVVPKPKHKQQNKNPRIAAAPNQVDHNTLLPQPAPGPAAVPLN
jgi:hypothetical protein